MPSTSARPHVAIDAFTPVVGQRVSTTIVQQIREMIVTHQLEAGARLPPERELAERLGVSRVTVRDALRVLEVLGLVDIRVGASGGAYVTAPSSSVVSEGIENLMRMSVATPEDIAEARLLLEMGIVALAVDHVTEDDIRVLREICQEGEDAFEAGTYDRSHSERFHSRLAEAAHNPALSLLANTFAGPLSMLGLRKREGEEVRHPRSIRFHRKIVDALEQRDHARAIELVADHLTTGLSENRRQVLLATFSYTGP